MRAYLTKVTLQGIIVLRLTDGCFATLELLRHKDIFLFLTHLGLRLLGPAEGHLTHNVRRSLLALAAGAKTAAQPCITDARGSGHVPAQNRVTEGRGSDVSL